MPGSEDSFATLVNQALRVCTTVYAEVGQFNVLVIGKTGVGKSTLINAVFQERLAETGVGYPVTQRIRRYRKPGFPITIYDTPGLELRDLQIEQVRLEVAQLIEEQRLQDPAEHIHVVWYCISHEAGRFEALERDWIQRLAIQEVPVVLVLTQALSVDERGDSDFVRQLVADNLAIRYLVPVLSEGKQLGRHWLDPFGLDRLAEATVELIPEVARDAFIRTQVGSIQLKANQAFKWLTAYVTAAFAVGAAPIPFSDAPILLAMQSTLIAHITSTFGLPPNQGFVSALLSSLVGVGGTTLAGRSLVTNLLKLIPGAGTVVGGAISAATASTLTLALGMAYIESLKRFMKSRLVGRPMSLSDLKGLLRDEYQYYLRTGRRQFRSEDEAHGATDPNWDLQEHEG